MKLTFAIGRLEEDGDKLGRLGTWEGTYRDRHAEMARSGNGYRGRASAGLTAACARCTAYQKLSSVMHCTLKELWSCEIIGVRALRRLRRFQVWPRERLCKVGNGREMTRCFQGCSSDLSSGWRIHNVVQVTYRSCSCENDLRC